MNEYINPNQEDYAVEHKRNILETYIGRKLLKKIEFEYEAIVESRIEESFSDE